MREKAEMIHLSDQELMALVQAGDYAPASVLFDRYSSRIYNFAYRFLRNNEAAEDATQEVFMKMMNRAHQFNGEAKLSTWLFSITANLCRDHLRKADNKAKEDDETLALIPSSDDSPEEQLAQRQEAERVRKALDMLTPEQKEAILLSRYQGLSYSEIAQVSGCSEGAVKTRVFRAMEALKRILVEDASGDARCLNVL